MKVVYDTCLYIDFLRSSDRLSLLLDRSQIRYLSPVVIMELRAGARTSRQKRIVDRLLAPYSKAQRIIHLNANLFYKAGEYLSKVTKSEFSKNLANDVLIALSAVSIGATLFTNNKKDFLKISEKIPVKVQWV